MYLTAEDLVDGEQTETEPEPASGGEEGGAGAPRLPKRAKREVARVEEEMEAEPAATAHVMPCRAVSAVGRPVRVWWLAAEGPKEGAMYLASVVAYNRRTGGWPPEGGEGPLIFLPCLGQASARGGEPSWESRLQLDPPDTAPGLGCPPCLHAGLHTLQYASDESCIKHALREETVDWGEGIVTGPGAAWPA